jgi:predicted GH43/DUF377 family glycosyl hydrolase
MRWRKQGLVYCPSGERPWAIHTAAVPTVLRINESELRIYVGSRDNTGVGRIGYVDVSAENPSQILRIAPEPVLDVGKPGMFDDNGVLPVSIVRDGGLIYLYYAGFQLGVKIDFFHLSGLAVSRDGGNTFTRIRQTPVLERTENELFLRSAPHILRGESIWKMWYIGFDGWLSGAKRIYRSRINYIESTDGIDWPAPSQCCIAPGSEDEFGFGRPFVYLDGPIYKMFYSIRTLSKGYRLGYAESKDGIHWVRLDEKLGLDVSAQGWDCNEICWCFVVRSNGQTIMFYNGNDYGRTGFGYAILAEDSWGASHIDDSCEVN